MRNTLAFGLLVFGWAAADAAMAERPAVLDRLVECRTIGEAAARLACYDRQVEALDIAEKRQDVMVVDRQQVRQAKRSLFGFSLPHIDLFGPRRAGGEEDDTPARIETTIQSASRDSGGHWRFVLADGARWEQIDTEPMNLDPRQGMAIAIRRAALGSYFANVAKQTAIRVRRVG